jgi:hypothetical protein
LVPLLTQSSNRGKDDQASTAKILAEEMPMMKFSAEPGRLCPPRRQSHMPDEPMTIGSTSNEGEFVKAA